MKKIMSFVLSFLTFSILLLSGVNFYQYFTKKKNLGWTNTIFGQSIDKDESRCYYAKVQSDGVYFFSEPTDFGDYKLFKLPTSYFVLLTGNANDLFYSCKYDDKFGYVKKSDVWPMDGTPTTPYASFASFRMWNIGGIEMRSSPHKKPQNVVANIDYLEDNLIYYGQIEGDELIPKKSNIWYYCKYVGPQSSQFGYVYSSVCDELSEIPLNMESFELKTGELFPQSSMPSPASKKMSGTSKVFIILAVSLPCLVILYLLIKPTLIMEGGKIKTVKNKAKARKKHGDYFEFDDGDLT